MRSLLSWDSHREPAQDADKLPQRHTVELVVEQPNGSSPIRPVIRVTIEHPFYAYNKGWVTVGDLEEGDRLLGMNGEWLAVQEIFDTGIEEAIYNLRVKDWHTYFVGCQDWGFSVWAHNACYVVEHTGNGWYKLKNSETGQYVKGTFKDGEFTIGGKEDLVLRGKDGVQPQLEGLATQFNDARNIGHFDSGQGFTGVYDSSTGKVLIVASTATRHMAAPPGWVPRAAGHFHVSRELGGGMENHRGFAVVIQEDGSLKVSWKSGQLNQPNPPGVVPEAERPAIIEAIKKATGREVVSE